jgi:hypothetical protein
VEPWEGLFHNLRASRQTELPDKFSAHVAASWLGNSPAIAERHYLLTIEAHYEQACQPIRAANALQQSTETTETNRTGEVIPRYEYDLIAARFFEVFGVAIR